MVFRCSGIFEEENRIRRLKKSLMRCTDKAIIFSPPKWKDRCKRLILATGRRKRFRRQRKRESLIEKISPLMASFLNPRCGRHWNNSSSSSVAPASERIYVRQGNEWNRKREFREEEWIHGVIQSSSENWISRFSVRFRLRTPLCETRENKRMNEWMRVESKGKSENENRDHEIGIPSASCCSMRISLRVTIWIQSHLPPNQVRQGIKQLSLCEKASFHLLFIQFPPSRHTSRVHALEGSRGNE